MAKMYSPLSEATILVTFSTDTRGRLTVLTCVDWVGLEMWNCKGRGERGGEGGIEVEGGGNERRGREREVEIVCVCDRDR